ncbi:MAG: response regulator [Candidatus Omnitrophica bacterium]|nr:response regulator [Candidatus Omnitrophota bacterium]
MKKKILVVDDAIFMRNYIRGILHNSNFEVCGEASDAIEAVEKYKQLKPDLVTMDIIMPRIDELDGIGAIKKIIAMDPQAKIIVISAIGEEHLVNEATNQGAKAFLIKPFKPDELIKLLKQIFPD